VISANALQLITIGCLLIVISFVLPRDPQMLQTTFRKIAFGLVKVMRLVGIAAVIAGAIILLLPILHASDLTDKTVKQLNEQIELYHHWLELSWIVLVVFILALLACVWFGWSEVTAARAGAAIRIVKITSTAKILAGFLACCTFVGAGVEGRIKDRASEAEGAAQKLSSLQLILFRHVEFEIERELVSETIHQASAQSPRVQQTIAAFRIVAPFLPYRPDFIPASYDNEDHKASAQHDSPPDVTLTQIAKIEEELKDEPKDDSPEGVLIEEVVHLTYDNTVSDAMKHYLLHIGNPIISEIVSAFMNPLFGESAERLIREQAKRMMGGHFDRSASEAQLRESTSSLQSEIVQRIVATQTKSGDEGELGGPGWARLRSVLRQAVMIGLPRKKPAIQDEARVMLTRYARFWEAVNIVVQVPENRRDYSEKVFSVYLKQNPDYAALWGYAVISATPPDYREELDASAQQNGPPGEILKSLKDLVRMKYSGDPTAVTSMKKFDPDDELTLASTRRDYGRVWYAYHGPYPQDGYVFYVKKTGGTLDDEAITYYQSPEVSRYVERYCPNNKDTSTE
jgi:hypothetical protein